MSRPTAEPAAIATVLIVDDEAAFADLIAERLTGAGYRILRADDANGALEILRQETPDLLLVDVQMPGMSGIELIEMLARQDRLPPTVVMSAYGRLETALAAVRAGALDFLSKPFRLPEVELKVQIAIERSRTRTTPGGREGRRSARDSAPPTMATDSAALYHGMVGRTPGMRALFAQIDRVARFSSTVLISGESGTGKELVARALHDASPRRSGPFVAVNCGAIPENLLESELFGHVRGAFTDANQDRVGRFEQAHGGTLLLDEIADLPLHLQVKLLRVMQEGEVRRVGGNRAVPVDVRVVGASARPLSSQVEAGLFRLDLFYRLSVIELKVPALRERLDDLPLLVQHIVERCNRRLGTATTGLHPHALARLMAHTWPGNIRELQNVIEQACVMSETDEIGVDALPETVTSGRREEGGRGAGLLAARADSLSIPRAIEATERALIVAALEKTAGNRTHAAELLEVSQRTLLNKIHRYEVDIPGQVGRPPGR